MDIEHILRNPAGIEAEGYEVAFSKCIRLLKSLAAGLLSPFKINVVKRIDGGTSAGDEAGWQKLVTPMGYLKYNAVICADELIRCGQLPARVGIGAKSRYIRIARGIRFQRENHVMHIVCAYLLELEQEHPVLQVGHIHL